MEKMEKMKVLNIYKLNIYQALTFVFKIKRVTTPAAFWDDFWDDISSLFYGFSQSNFVVGNILSNQTKFWNILWNILLNQEQKNMAYINGFKNSVKTSLLCLENEIIYFWIWGRKIRDKN